MAESKKRKRYDSEIAASRRYDARTYKRFSILFRLDEDADIIAALDIAHEHGIAGRELIGEWFESWKREQ